MMINIPVSSNNEMKNFFWKIPEDCSIYFVDNRNELSIVQSALSGASVVAIDAEWPPEQSTHCPSATVLQLAIWNQQHRSLKVFVVDVLALDDIDVSILLNFFKKRDVIKLGYSLRSDVFALSSFLDRNRHTTMESNTIIEPVVDIGTLHRHLCRVNCPGVQPSLGGGLSGVVNSNLGLPLDKTQQCSAWGHRPLTQEQIEYAATDACCLIALFCLFVEKSIAQTRSDKIHSENDEASLIATWCERWHIFSRNKIQRSGGLYQTSAANGELHSRGKKTSMKKSGLSRKLEMYGTFPFPLHVPWMDASQNVIDAPKFLADVMCSGTARQLRLYGFDAEELPCASKQERHLQHRRLVEQSNEEGRVILTRDHVFCSRNLSDSCYFVRSDTKQKQVEEVIKSFKLEMLVDRDALLSRCPKCNGSLLEEPVPAARLKEKPFEEHGVPAGVFENVREFWVCRRCKKAYWQGNMYDRAMERLGKAMMSMKVKEEENGEENSHK